MKIKYLIVIFTLLIASCATVNNKQNNDKATNAQPIEISNPPENLASIYVWREDAFVLSAVDIPFAINSRSISNARLNEYFVVNVITGKYVVSTNFNGKSNVEINATAGKSYFVRVCTKFFGENLMGASFYLKEVEQQDAVNEIKTSYKKLSIDYVADKNEQYYLFSNGAKYFGEFDEYQKPSGYGKVVFKNGDSFTGKFLKGEPTEGSYVFTSNKDGLIVSGEIQGKTKGEVEKLSMSGHAKAEASNGFSYNGGYSNNSFNGKGLMIFASDHNYLSYEGDFKKGKFNGLGVLKHKNGNFYSGEFEDGALNGKGIASFNDSTYEGTFYKNKIQGRGIYKFNDGRMYDGEVNTGNPDDNGKFVRTDGSFIVGKFDNGKFVGGKHYSSNGGLLRDDDQLRQAANLADVGDFLAELSVFALKMTAAFYSGYSQSNHRNYDYLDMDLGGVNNNPNQAVEIGKSNKKIDSAVECISDQQCGFGNSCVKKPYSTTGVCMVAVNSSGIRTYKQPDPDSINIKSAPDCNFNTDCPIGFSCDPTYKACVKKQY